MTGLVALAMFIGLAGTFLPVVPGLTLMWAAALGHAFIDGLSVGDVLAMAIITALTIVGYAASAVLPARRAGAVGATRASLILGATVGFLAFFTIPIVGFPMGGILGVYAGERLDGRDHTTAVAAARSTLIGIGLGVVAQFTAGSSILFCWVAWVLGT